MKKHNKRFSKALILASLISSPAFASNSGQYVGVDYVNTRMRYREVVDMTKTFSPDPYSIPNNSMGFGANYKYQINYNDFFVAPGLFFERNRAEANYNLPGLPQILQNTIHDKSIKLKNRYGIKADIGYKLIDGVFPYLTGGYGVVRYSSNNKTTIDDPTYSLHRNTGSPFYGFGLRINYSEKISLNLEYNAQAFTAQTKTLESEYLVPGGYTSRYDTKLNLVKFGVSYQF